MPIYIYKAITSTGRELTREAVAPTVNDLRRELEGQGLLVKDIHLRWIPGLFPFFQSHKVKPSDFLQFNQELITLLRAGLTVPEALELASEGREAKVLTATMKKILEDVRGGTALSLACAKYPRIFDGLYLSSLKTGEKSGDLAAPLSRYQEYLRRKAALEGKISQAMVYPFFLLSVLVMVLLLLFTFVMPRFAALYADFNATLPLATRVLMGFVQHIGLVGAVLGGLALFLGLAWKTWSSTKTGRLKIDAAMERLPLARGFTQPFLVSQTARTLSTLLSGGTPLAEALQTAQEALSNKAYAERFHKAITLVLEGNGLSKALREQDLMPRRAAKLIEVGEASGRLEEMLQEIASSFEQLLDSRVQRVMALIEPLFILLTGVLIGTIVVVMYLPIIHLSDIVK